MTLTLLGFQSNVIRAAATEADHARSEDVHRSYRIDVDLEEWRREAIM